MPISTPSQSYNLSPVGTSGTAVGPSILIASDDGLWAPLARGLKGCIMIRGPPCFQGYESTPGGRDDECAAVFHTINGEDGWFDTGDLGHLDEEGHLFISGRSKEIINRGGETISPMEVEGVLQQHEAVREVMCFATPHNQFQETIGAVVVVENGLPRPDLHSLHHFLADRLHRSKWPQVCLPRLPFHTHIPPKIHARCRH